MNRQGRILQRLVDAWQRAVQKINRAHAETAQPIERPELQPMEMPTAKIFDMTPYLPHSMAPLFSRPSTFLTDQIDKWATIPFTGDEMSEQKLTDGTDRTFSLAGAKQFKQECLVERQDEELWRTVTGLWVLHQWSPFLTVSDEWTTISKERVASWLWHNGHVPESLLETDNPGGWATQPSEAQRKSSWPGEWCKRCDQRNVIGFNIDDAIWAAVVRDRWNVLCATCFDYEAELAGIKYEFGLVWPVSWSDWIEPGKDAIEEIEPSES